MNAFLASTRPISHGIGESKSNSASARKKERYGIGHYYDGIFTVDSREVGVAEHSRGHPDRNQRKWTSDRLKTAKALHDMLSESSSGMAVFGLVSAARCCQMMRMSYAKGYICVLNSDERREVPLQVSAFNSQRFALLLGMVWNMRAMLSRNPGLSPSTPLAADLEAELLALDDLPPCASAPASVFATPRIPPSIETDEEYGSDEEDHFEERGAAELRLRVGELEQQLARMKDLEQELARMKELEQQSAA